MALPTKSDLTNLSYSYLGEPFVDVPGNSSIDLTTMSWSYLGEPFVSNGDGGGAVTVTPKRCLLGCGI